MHFTYMKRLRLADDIQNTFRVKNTWLTSLCRLQCMRDVY